jgi:hypothetical protein
MKLPIRMPDTPQNENSAGGSPSNRPKKRGRGTSIRVAFLLALTSLIGGVQAQSAPGSQSERFPEVETTWPGVRFQLFRIERNSLNRLVVAVRIVATDKAPPTGTFLGTKTPIPANASPVDIGMGVYDPKPFSLGASEMIDDETGRKYPVLPPIAPPGRTYLPGTIAKSLSPGQAEVLTIQFAIPPSPSADENRKQTVSFLFPNAKAPITKVPIPTPSDVSEPASKANQS